MGLRPPLTLYFQTKLNSLLDPLHQCVERLCLGVASIELRDLGDEISLFILLNDNGKFLHAILLDKLQIASKN